MPTLVEMHAKVRFLEIESDQLNTTVPHHDGVVVTRVEPAPLGVCTHQLTLGAFQHVWWCVLGWGIPSNTVRKYTSKFFRVKYWTCEMQYCTWLHLLIFIAHQTYFDLINKILCLLVPLTSLWLVTELDCQGLSKWEHLRDGSCLLFPPAPRLDRDGATINDQLLQALTRLFIQELLVVLSHFILYYKVFHLSELCGVRVCGMCVCVIWRFSIWQMYSIWHWELH